MFGTETFEFITFDYKLQEAVTSDHYWNFVFLISSQRIFNVKESNHPIGRKTFGAKTQEQDC